MAEGQTGLVELYLPVAVVVGMIAFMFKTKWACWRSLFLYFFSTINMKADNRAQ